MPTRFITVFEDDGLGNVLKLIWTVDVQKAEEFKQTYNPSCDIILIQINWE
ncbi:ThaI family type II restriction endonuclease [bacterium]|nr:ThaI family type II restriction endonuclease [bacterium]